MGDKISFSSLRKYLEFSMAWHKINVSMRGKVSHTNAVVSNLNFVLKLVHVESLQEDRLLCC